MELIVLLAGEPGVVLDLWLNQHENTAEFWLLLSSPCSSSRFFSLFPHSAPRASSGRQEAGRAHGLDRDLAMLITKFKLPALTLPPAPVPCTDKHRHGEGSSPNQGFPPGRPPGLGDQTEWPIPPRHCPLEQLECPQGAAPGDCLPENGDTVTTAATKGMKRKSSSKSFRAVLNTGAVSLYRKI